MAVAENYGASRNWSLDRPDGQEVYRGLAMMVLWARGFATGQFTDGFKKTATDQKWDRGLPKVPDFLTGQYRQKFLALYPPHLRNLDPSNVIKGPVSGGTPVGAVAVVLLALGALMYLTRR